MKLVSYWGEKNTPCTGVLLEDSRVLQLNKPDSGLPDSLRTLLEGGEEMMARVQGFISKAEGSGAETIPLEKIRLRPVIPDPGKFLLCGVNYKKHILEMGRKLPEKPSIFGRFNHTLLGSGDPIIAPKTSICVDWEGELVVVIGKKGKHITREQALDYVAGYTCFNDVSIRDVQTGLPQITIGKNFDASGPLGPCMVTSDELANPHALELTTKLNGEIMQHGNTEELIFDIPYLIELISSAMTLYPGDLISTGTPDGVGHGRDPKVYMKPGDQISVTIQGIGELKNPVIMEQ